MQRASRKRRAQRAGAEGSGTWRNSRGAEGARPGHSRRQAMKLRTFFGLTSRSVLDQVRCELGADAMIVANRATADGIEVTAVASGAIDSLLREPSAAVERTAHATAAVSPAPNAGLPSPDEPGVKPWRPPVMMTSPANNATEIGRASCRERV